MKGCYLVRTKKEHQRQEFISIIYAESFDDFYMQVDEQGYEPETIEYKKIKIGAISLKVDRQIFKDADFEYEDCHFEFNQFSEYMLDSMDKDSGGWKSFDCSKMFQFQ